MGNLTPLPPRAGAFFSPPGFQTESPCKPYPVGLPSVIDQDRCPSNCFRPTAPPFRRGPHLPIPGGPFRRPTDRRRPHMAKARGDFTEILVRRQTLSPDQLEEAK